MEDLVQVFFFLKSIATSLQDFLQVPIEIFSIIIDIFVQIRGETLGHSLNYLVLGDCSGRRTLLRHVSGLDDLYSDAQNFKMHYALSFELNPTSSHDTDINPYDNTIKTHHNVYRRIDWDNATFSNRWLFTDHIYFALIDVCIVVISAKAGEYETTLSRIEEIMTLIAMKCKKSVRILMLVNKVLLLNSSDTLF